MYAVIKTGGKQYRVASGEKIKVEQIAADVGQEIVIDQVLAVGNGSELKVGTPLVSGATVKATVVAHGKHDKVRIFKMRRRKHYQKRQGHRQQRPGHQAHHRQHLATTDLKAHPGDHIERTLWGLEGHAQVLHAQQERGRRRGRRGGRERFCRGVGQMHGRLFWILAVIFWIFTALLHIHYAESPMFTLGHGAAWIRP